MLQNAVLAALAAARRLSCTALGHDTVCTGAGLLVLLSGWRSPLQLSCFFIPTSHARDSVSDKGYRDGRDCDCNSGHGLRVPCPAVAVAVHEGTALLGAPPHMPI